jgi:hypothetical protein
MSVLLVPALADRQLLPRAVIPGLLALTRATRISLGTASVRKPSFEPFLMMSQSKVSRGSAMASRSSEIGRISSSANLRAVKGERYI